MVIAEFLTEIEHLLEDSRGNIRARPDHRKAMDALMVLARRACAVLAHRYGEDSSPLPTKVMHPVPDATLIQWPRSIFW